MSVLFEKKLNKDTSELFGYEPISGHRERFAEKLASQEKMKRRRKRNYFLPIVAVIAAVLTGVIFLIQPIASDRTHNESLAEVEYYYAGLFEEKINEIEVLLEDVSNEEKSGILNDIELMKSETNQALQFSEEENISFVFVLYSSNIDALTHIRDMLQ